MPDNSQSLAAEVTFAQGQHYGAAGAPEYRDCPVFAPGGISWRPKAGQTLLLTPCSGGMVCAGAQVQQEVAPGELRLSCGSGYIHLKANGEILINGVVVSLDGRIIPPQP